MRVEEIFYFWISLFSLFLFIQVIQWIQNTKIKKRYKKFKYFTDYARFKDLINPKINKIIIVFANLLLVLSLAFLITFTVIDFQVYQYYYVMLIPIVVSDATIIFHELTRKKQQLDLEDVDTAYYKIDGMITNTDRYVSERESVIKEVNQYMEATQIELAPLLGKSSSALFTSIIDDLNIKKASLQSKIDNLQKNIETLKAAFLEALNHKLKNEKTSFTKIFKTSSTDSAERDPADEMVEIRRSTEEKIAKAIDSYVSIATSLPLKEIQIIFQTYSKFNDTIQTDSIIGVLEKMTLETSEQEIFVELLYSIPMDIGEVFKLYFIPKDIQWVYTSDFTQMLTPAQKRAVYKELIHQKASQSLQKILSQLDPVTLSEIDELSHIVKVEEEVLAKIKRYQRITDRLYQSFNALNAVENIYLIMNQMEKPLPETREFIKSHPIESTDLNLLADSVFEFYHREFARISFDVIAMIELMDTFKSLNDASRNLFDWNRLEEFILENAALLKIDYVYLGWGLFIADLEKTNLISKIKEISSWGQDTFKRLLLRFDSTQSLDYTRIKETGRLEKNILSHPRFTPFKDRLPNIIMRIENQRMTLEEIRI